MGAQLSAVHDYFIDEKAIEEEPPTQLRIEQNQKLTRDLERRLERNADAAQRCREQARACASSDRHRALFHLKRAHIHEAGQEALQGKIMNMHRVTLSLEQAVLSQQTAAGMKGAADALQTQERCPDAVQDAMDSVSDQVELQDEFNAALACDTVCDSESEQQVLQELERMCAQPPSQPEDGEQDEVVHTDNPGQPPDDFALPEAPTHALPAVKKPSLRLLEESMA